MMQINRRFALGFIVAGCLSRAGYQDYLRRELEETATQYLESLRWKQPEDAMAFVDSQHAKEVWPDLARFKTLHITEYELTETMVHKSDRTARVKIAYSVYDDRELKVERHIRDQRWTRDGGRWKLMFEKDLVPYE